MLYGNTVHVGRRWMDGSKLTLDLQIGHSWLLVLSVLAFYKTIRILFGWHDILKIYRKTLCNARAALRFFSALW